MEVQANKRIDSTFEPGDLVLLRLQPYGQQTVHHRSSQKLSKQYFGPFKVLHRVGAVAYKLELLSTSHIHLVVHVSQLRAYYGKDPVSHFVPIPNDMGVHDLAREQEGDSLYLDPEKTKVEGREKVTSTEKAKQITSLKSSSIYLDTPSEAFDFTTGDKSLPTHAANTSLSVWAFDFKFSISRRIWTIG